MLLSREKQATVAATADRFGVNADAVIGVETPYPSMVKVQVSDLNLQALPLNLQTPLEGVLRASMEGTGDLANPEGGRATATIDAFAGTWKGHSFSIDTPAQLAYANERLAIERLRVVAQDSAVLVTRRAADDRSRRHRRADDRRAGEPRHARPVRACRNRSRRLWRDDVDRRDSRHAQGHRSRPGSHRCERLYCHARHRARTVEPESPRTGRERRGEHRSADGQLGSRAPRGLGPHSARGVARPARRDSPEGRPRNVHCIGRESGSGADSWSA